MKGVRLEDIRNRADISALVVAFYTRAFADDEIGYIFTEVMHMDVQAHLPVMCDFWETVLFQAGSYRRDAFEIHRTIDALEPLTREHFQRWENVWHQTVEEMFNGEKANLAKLHGSRMAGSISRRLAKGGNADLLQLNRASKLA